MKDPLPATVLNVIQQLIPIFGDMLPPSHRLTGHQQFRHNGTILISQIIDAANMLFRNNQQVDGCVGMDVLENDHILGFKQKFSIGISLDDIAEKAMMNRIVSPVLYLLAKLRWIQHGHIQLYIGYIVVTIIALLLFI